MSTPTAPTVVWTEIPVTDLGAAMRFYESVFGWKMHLDEIGPNPMANFSSDMAGIHGHLYPGTPAAGATTHFALPGTLAEGRAACEAAGGTVLSDDIAIPVGRFAYALDPDGNSIGLFERA